MTVAPALRKPALKAPSVPVRAAERNRPLPHLSAFPSSAFPSSPTVFDLGEMVGCGRGGSGGSVIAFGRPAPTLSSSRVMFFIFALEACGCGCMWVCCFCIVALRGFLHRELG